MNKNSHAVAITDL